MKYKIVSDSSSDLLTVEQVPYSSVPLHILVGSQEFVDDASIDLARMEEVLAAHKGRSGTACPGVNDWLQAFGDAESVFGITITSALSGSYNSAMAAKMQYEAQFPGRNVHIIDSLSTGPEMALMIEKLQELILAGRERDEIRREITEYTRRTRLLFSLENLRNLANNGRISHASAKLAGVLGIRVVGQASEQGELQLLNKCRGEQCMITAMLRQMKQLGYRDGKVRISHNNNEAAAEKLKEQIEEAFHTADIRVYRARGLCSFYAEKGGILIGMECGQAATGGSNVSEEKDTAGGL